MLFRFFVSPKESPHQWIPNRFSNFMIKHHFFLFYCQRFLTIIFVVFLAVCVCVRMGIRWALSAWWTGKRSKCSTLLHSDVFHASKYSSENKAFVIFLSGQKCVLSSLIYSFVFIFFSAVSIRSQCFGQLVHILCCFLFKYFLNSYWGS